MGKEQNSRVYSNKYKIESAPLEAVEERVNVADLLAEIKSRDQEAERRHTATKKRSDQRRKANSMDWRDLE